LDSTYGPGQLPRRRLGWRPRGSCLRRSSPLR